MTNRPELKQKPLIEAIFEVRWALLQPAPDVRIDPHYRLLLGRLYDRILKEYPIHEPLPTAFLPDDVVPQTVQHRFRRVADGWPLIQMGPGLMTLNETSAYSWEDFRERCIQAVATLWDAHPNPEELHIEALNLRYLNAVEFDHTQESIFTFLQDRMSVGAGLPEALFQAGNISRRPQGFTSRSTFQCLRPKGRVALQFDTAFGNKKPILRWETNMISADADVPATLPAELQAWINEAHQIIDDCFYALVPQHLRLPQPQTT